MFVSGCCVCSDADTPLDNSDKELYCLGEAVKLGKEGKEVILADLLGRKRYQVHGDGLLLFCYTCSAALRMPGYFCF